MTNPFTAFARWADKIGDIQISETTHMRLMIALYVGIAAAASFLPGLDAPAKAPPKQTLTKTLF